MKRTAIFFTEPQVKRLKKLQRETGKTMSEHIRRALDDYFEKLDKKAGK